MSSGGGGGGGGSGVAYVFVSPRKTTLVPVPMRVAVPPMLADMAMDRYIAFPRRWTDNRL